MKEQYMKKALELALRGSGFVNPDPLSGAVIIKDEIIVGEGYYKGFDHEPAECMALNMDGDFNAADMYITIEPFGSAHIIQDIIRKIAERGIRKIYMGMRDPNPIKTIDFQEELEKMDIQYEYGVLREECEELNEIYAHYIRNRTPYVIVKWAMTMDGKLATRTGDSKWISSEDSLRFVHHLRQRVTAIMVGENTVIKDDPQLTTRLENIKVSNPLRVIISKYGELPMNAKILQIDENTQTMIIASDKISPLKEKKLTDKGAKVIKLKESDGYLDFNEIMTVLGDLGIDSLYIEGGSSILASAFESGCVHKVYTAIAPKIIGGKNAITPVGGRGIELMRDAIVLYKVSHEIVGPDVIMKGYIEKQ